jgi:hypothetical protein
MSRTVFCVKHQADTEGLAFMGLDSDQSPQHARLLHEQMGISLVSHFVDPVFSCMRGLPASAFITEAVAQMA